MAFIAAWLGWAFDGLDGFLYTLVAVPFVLQLMTKNGVKPDMGQVTEHAAMIQAVFLVGWAIGGAFFGWVGDRLGRSKTLALTIVTYAVFTGLHAFATEWWHLLILRFIAALGIGGEWAAGSALVSETMPKRYRFLSGAILQSGYMAGQILAGLTTLNMSGFDPRWVFVVGVLPAFFTLWLRRNVGESPEWHEKRQVASAKVSELFKGRVLKTTILTVCITSICLITIWGLFYYSTQVIRAAGLSMKLAPPQITVIASWALIIGAVWNIVGNFFCVWLFRQIGIRRGFAILMVLSLVCFFKYAEAGKAATDMESLYVAIRWYYASLFFCGGLFAIFPVYLPPLFPTMLRTTGSGLCYNFGRIASAVGTVYGGVIAANYGGPAAVIHNLAFLYIPGILIAFLLPEMNRAGITTEEELSPP